VPHKNNLKLNDAKFVIQKYVGLLLPFRFVCQKLVFGTITLVAVGLSFQLRVGNF